MKEKMQAKNRIGGISAKTLAIPFLLVVAALLISIVLLIIDINHSSTSLFGLMERSGAYQIDAYDMQASNTTLSETCSTYVQMPLLPNESTNLGPLMTFVNELDSERRAPKIAQRFQEYDVSYAARACVERAAEYSEQLLDTQIHAIAIISSIPDYALPVDEIPSLSIFIDYDLTQEEQNKTKEEKITYAKSLITAQSYAQTRSYVAQNITECNNILKEEFSQAQANTRKHVTTMRDVLWVEIFAIIFILSGGFAVLYLLILKPLENYSKDITSNQSISHKAKLSEMKQLVSSFNGLWDYRNKLEEILRTEAENDALTGLPNRYCMEHDLLKLENSNKSIAVLMFDVNFLKQINDTEGHLAGDKLIRTTASCIKECFDVENNCYRIGGDEFLVLLYDCKREEIKRRVERFKMTLLREKISVSVGYAYSNKTEKDSFKDLLAEADKSMYKQKKQVHNVSEK